MRPIPTLLLCASLLFAPCTAHALNGSVGVGFADPHDGEGSHVVELSLRWPSSGSLPLVDEHEFLAGHIDARPLPELDRNMVYMGYGVRSHFGRWYTGFAVVAVDNTSESLSSWYQFVSTGGVRVGRASLTLRHLSNSGFRGRNRGETFVLLGLEW